MVNGESGISDKTEAFKAAVTFHPVYIKHDLNGHKFDNLWIIIINYEGYHITLSYFNMRIRHQLLHKHTRETTDTQGNPGCFPQIQPVSVESKTKEKLYPLFLSVIYKCTHAGVSMKLM